MNPSKVSGAAIAAAAVALFVSGCTHTAGTSATTAAPSSGDVMVKCYGANACKGQAECKTAMNGCKGQNACKGKGFHMMGEQACVDRLGRT
jgi:hypothetical protein